MSRTGPGVDAVWSQNGQTTIIRRFSPQELPEPAMPRLRPLLGSPRRADFRPEIGLTRYEN